MKCVNCPLFPPQHFRATDRLEYYNLHFYCPVSSSFSEIHIGGVSWLKNEYWDTSVYIKLYLIFFLFLFFFCLFSAPPPQPLSLCQLPISVLGYRDLCVCESSDYVHIDTLCWRIAWLSGVITTRKKTGRTLMSLKLSLDAIWSMEFKVTVTDGTIGSWLTRTPAVREWCDDNREGRH